MNQTVFPRTRGVTPQEADRASTSGKPRPPSPSWGSRSTTSTLSPRSITSTRKVLSDRLSTTTAGEWAWTTAFATSSLVRSAATSTTSLSAQPRQDRRTKRRAFAALDGSGRKNAAGSISPADAKVCVPNTRRHRCLSLYPRIRTGPLRRRGSYGRNQRTPSGRSQREAPYPRGATGSDRITPSASLPRPIAVVAERGGHIAEIARRPRRLSITARLSIIEEVATRLADSHGVAEVADAIGSSLDVGLGVTAVVLNVVSADGNGLATLYESGTSERTHDLLQGYVPFEDGPAKAVLASGEPVYWSTLGQRNRDYPEYAGFPSSCQSWAILPLTAHGMTFGVLSVGWADPRRFGREDSALLHVIAHQCAIAVDRARLEEVERSERETLELMSEGTRVMVSELDPASVVRKLVLLAVPRLAPWCAVYVAERTTLRRVAIEIAEDADLAEELRGLEAVGIGSDSPLSLCYRTGKAQVVPRVTEKEVRSYSHAQRERFLSATASWTALIVPIKAGGK